MRGPNRLEKIHGKQMSQMPLQDTIQRSANGQKNNKSKIIVIMLLTTSRKPSQRTRSFCQKLKRAIGCPYINRGKMNIQEILQKTIEHKESTVAIVSEKRGNPSKITFYNINGEQIGYMTINVAIPKKLETEPTMNIKGAIENIKPLKKLIPFKENGGEHSWIVKPAKNKYTAILELYHEKKPSGLKIFIKKIHLEDEN